MFMSPAADCHHTAASDGAATAGRPGAADRADDAPAAVRRPRHPSAIAVCALSGEARSVFWARSFTRTQLIAWQLSDQAVADARLVVSELVTNAVVHGKAADISLKLALTGGHLWVEVDDNGGWQHPAGTDARREGECGRGLHLVQALAQGSGVYANGSGTCAWALLPASGAGTPAAAGSAPVTG